jgi:hypothetical protein
MYPSFQKAKELKTIQFWALDVQSYGLYEAARLHLQVQCSRRRTSYLRKRNHHESSAPPTFELNPVDVPTGEEIPAPASNVGTAVHFYIRHVDPLKKK